MNEGLTFSPGSTLRDVPPHVHGISREEFIRRDLKAQCDAYLKTQVGLQSEISRKPVTTYKKHKAAKDNQ